MSIGGKTTRARKLLIAAIVLALAIVAVASPAFSTSGGVGNHNLQASDCSAHSVTSSATIAMSASKLNPTPGEQITVKVTVTGGPTSGLMGVALLSKTSGSTGTTPSENGWTVVKDPSGTTYNYIEQSYTGSKDFTWTLKAPTSGSPKLYAKIFHGSAAYVKTYSTGLSFAIAAPPTVQITSPANQATVSGTITVTASITPGAGATITSAELKVDAVSVGTDASSPYSWSLSTLTYTNAAHTLQVTATDNGGMTGSAQITVTVSNVASPSVAITSPANGATIGGTVAVSATATAASGASISSVQMSVDGALMGTDTTSPYSISLDTLSLSKGAHTIKVTAVDNGGRQGSDQITVNVNNDPPTVSFASPVPGVTLTGTTTVNAAAMAYADRTISSVELRVDGSSVGAVSSSPFSWTLDTSAMTAGQHALNLTCIDSLGLRGYSQISVNVDNSAPVVTISRPLNGAEVKGQMIVEAQVVSSFAISKASLLFDGRLIGDLASAPFTWTLDTAAYADGQHVIQVIAVDSYSRSGNQQVTVTVNNTGSAILVPVVAIGSPSNGATLSGNVSVTSDVTSGRPISWVALYLDGLLLGNASLAPYQWVIPTYEHQDGQHSLAVVACDDGGSRGEMVLSVLFSNPAPLVISSLTDGSYVFGVLEASISADSSAPLLSIEVWLDGGLVSSIAPPAGSWGYNTNDLAMGAHVVSIVATAVNGKAGFANVTIMVDNSPPTIELLSPTIGDVLYGDILVSVLITSNFTTGSANLTIGSIDFGETASSPYQWYVDTNLLPDGPSTMLITATSSNNKSSYLECNITVHNSPPSLALEPPQGSGPFSGNISIGFNASSAVGIDYLWVGLDSLELANLTQAPYSMVIETYAIDNGEHVLRALAHAVNGRSAEANWSFAVDNPLPSIAILEPSASEISGLFEVVVSVSAPYDISYITISVDDVTTANLTDSPYAVAMDASSYANGEHLLNVTAVGIGGQASSRAMVLTVANQPQQNIELGGVDLVIIQGLVIILITGLAVKLGGRRKK